MSHGGIAHIEFHTTDLAASRRFYEEIFGWTFKIIAGWGTYAMFTTPDGQGGGFDAGPQADAPSDKGPTLHIEVVDIDAAVGKIERVGGRALVRKTKISDEFGYFALFLDNVGNRLGLWSRT
jgi:hypothetical protein